MEFFLHGIPVTVALAAVALFGYIFGRRAKNMLEPEISTVVRRELRRATAVARELELIAEELRKELASHHSSLSRFQGRVASLSAGQPDSILTDLCREAEQVLKPTIRLSSQLAQAYDEIRQQSNQLMSFTEVRTDPLTGVSNRRALEESLRVMFGLFARYNRLFSIAIFDIDHFKAVNDQHGHVHGDQILREVARLLCDAVRETDLVARYGGEEFVVVMPQTDLAGAAIFAERMRLCVAQMTSLTISGGIAQTQAGDDSQTLLARADLALYAAKAAGRNCVFDHDGVDVRPLAESVAAECKISMMPPSVAPAGDIPGGTPA
jgi:diguanylate cyclase (GGDEF)-like protein